MQTEQMVEAASDARRIQNSRGENATGNNIRRLRMERGLTVRDLQSYFGFEEPRAIYKWQKGESLPTVDNLYALGVLFEVPIDQILVPVIKLHIVSEQQAESCCSHHFLPPGRSGRAPCADGGCCFPSR